MAKSQLCTYFDIKRILILISLTIFPSFIFGATLTVTTGADGPIGSVPGCSFREAVNAMNNQSNGNGCFNSSFLPYGTSNRIRFAQGVNSISLSQPLNPIATVSVSIRVPIDIRGRSNSFVTIDGGGGNLTLIENSSILTLRFLRIRNGRGGLLNLATGDARLRSVSLSGHSRRAIINRGIMTLRDSSVRGNPGGAILNANEVPVELLGGNPLLLSEFCDPNIDCCFHQCGEGDGNNSQVFPPGEAPSSMVIDESMINSNGPIGCAGLANGGGIVRDSGGITGGNPLIQRKLEGAVVVQRTRFSNNDSRPMDGGGICNSSTALITRSEISGNLAGRGAGIASLGIESFSLQITARPLTIITNSTISNNTSTGRGGGIFIGSSDGSVRISYSTIAFNRSSGSGPEDAGGLAATSQTEAIFRFSALVRNSSQAQGESVQNCHNVTLNGDFNFWARLNPGNCPFTGGQNNITTGDPLLGPLFGVPLRAHVPGANSILVDSIPLDNPACTGTDQRGFLRPRNVAGNNRDGCDIGAVER